MGGGLFYSVFHDIASVANLLLAWQEFRKGKRKKKDVEQFDLNLEDNLFKLHEELLGSNFKLHPYEIFTVSDPKPRNIHKASVRDRVLNLAVHRVLYLIFEKSFIFDSYSSRKGKGLHLGVKRLFNATRKVSQNWHTSGYVLKCDVNKFFDSVDHKILFELLKRRVQEKETLYLLQIILQSFEKSTGKGLPLGNVTSQLFANVYLHELDRFVKHTLKVKYYFRYADDFVILHNNKKVLENFETAIKKFLQDNLLLKIHENQILIRKVNQGIDFLGYVILPHALVLRTKTKNRIINKILNTKSLDEKFFQSLDSYLGVLRHCSSRQIKKEIFEILLS